MNKEKMFITRDENNKEVAYEMLYTKNVDNVPVVWYTDGTFDEEGNKNIYISSYKRENGTFVLDAINNDELMKKYEDIFLNEYKEN